MKLLGQLIVWLSVAVGAMSASTAYLVDLRLPDEQLVGLTAAPLPETTRMTHRPATVIVEKNQQLTAENLAELRDAEQRNLRVTEFSVWRWRGKWWFGLSLVGLLAGALVTRRAARPDRRADEKADSRQSPEQIADAIEREIGELLAQLPKQADRQTQLDLIVDRVGRLQQTHMEELVDARDVLIARLGLGGFAVVMDQYAAAERQINRAWSAAVDGAHEEATGCLAEAASLLKHMRAALVASTAE